MTRTQRIMDQYQCTAEDAQRFIDLRDEGYSISQAELMAGIADPPDPDMYPPDAALSQQGKEGGAA